MSVQAVADEENIDYEELKRQCGTSKWDLWDEVTGLPLPEDAVLKAQKEELAEYARFEVASECDDDEAWTETGAAPVQSRWRVINKGDAEHMEVRARLVAREFRRAGVDTIFAPTPPLAAFRLLCSRALVQKPGPPRKLFVVDIRRAFFHARSKRAVFVKPPGLRGTKRCWRCKKAMYGTLGAASDFQDELRDGMEKDVGMKSGAAIPTLFYDDIQDIAAVGHGDDLLFEAPEVQGIAAIERIRQRFDLVVKAKLGPGPGDNKEALLLNRVLTWTENNGKQIVRWEADPRQVELLLAEVGCLKCKPQVSPGLRPTQDEWAAAVELPEEQATAYRRSAARLNYLCLDRPGVLFGGKECCRGMAVPNDVHLRLLKDVQDIWLEGRGCSRSLWSSSRRKF